MLFERRAYTLRPGSEQTYWELQRQWNKPASFRPLLERNLGYFAMTAGDGERIVHLYRWDSYDDAKQRLGAIVTPERMEYFVTARSFLLRQENSYLDHAPVAELSPLWNDKRDWLPKSARVYERRQRIRTGGLRARSRFSSRRAACVLGWFSQTERRDDGRISRPSGGGLLCDRR